MKIKILFILAIVLTSFNSSAGVSDYMVDDQAIEMTFNQSIQNTYLENPESLIDGYGLTSDGALITAENRGVVAFVLSLFIGYWGVHRIYMGTKVLTAVGYILTFGGLGVVWIVDTVLLGIKALEGSSISQYENNPKFFMW